MPENGSSPLVLCFGEALWDVFPDDMHPGGAPLNVAYHLSKLGCRAAPVTAIGRDALGVRLLDQMRDWGLETAFVTQNKRPTGLVSVSLDKSGNAEYTINEGVAWDRIALDGRQLEHAAGAAAIVFGTLALRRKHNKTELSRLLARCAGALKVYDVNLRPPHTPAAHVWQAAQHADVIKLNADELSALLHDAIDTGRLDADAITPYDLEATARKFRELTRCSSVCVTAAAAGAGLLHREKWHWADAQPVDVKDTVGAGDAFLAALTNGLLIGSAPQLALANACRLAEFITTHTSATPEYTFADLNPISKHSAQT